MTALLDTLPYARFLGLTTEQTGDVNRDLYLASLTPDPRHRPAISNAPHLLELLIGSHDCPVWDRDVSNERR